MGFMISSINAPNFPLKTNVGQDILWFNSPPLDMQSLQGKVVLVDFWTYSCINCQRTLPFLQKWWEKYHNSGLIIIGVHTPEFEFEKDPENIKKALKKYDIEYPVVLDNDFQIWESYSNHYWPAKYLVDSKGKVIYNHFGEGNYIETEVKIQEALKEAGFKISDQIVSETENQSGALWKTQTPETYLGNARGNPQKLSDENNLEPDVVYLKGEWKVEPEYTQHTRKTEDLEDILILKYTSREVFLVMGIEDNSSIKVYVTLDGVPLTEQTAGKDIKFDEEKRAYAEVSMATLYNLVSTNTFGDHILRLSTTSDQLRCFAFTFGS